MDEWPADSRLSGRTGCRCSQPAWVNLLPHRLRGRFFRWFLPLGYRVTLQHDLAHLMTPVLRPWISTGRTKSSVELFTIYLWFRECLGPMRVTGCAVWKCFARVILMRAPGFIYPSANSGEAEVDFTSAAAASHRHRAGLAFNRRTVSFPSRSPWPEPGQAILPGGFGSAPSCKFSGHKCHPHQTADRKQIYLLKVHKSKILGTWEPLQNGIALVVCFQA